MIILFSTFKTDASPGNPISITCPQCREQSLESPTWLVTIREQFMGGIQATVTHKTYIDCRICGQRFVSNCSIDFLQSLNITETSRHLYIDVEFLHRFYAILLLLFFWLPVISVLGSLVIVVKYWRIPHWIRLTSRVSLLLSIIATILFYVYVN